MATKKTQPGEPMTGVMISGVLHSVPQSRADLEREIGVGAQLHAEVDDLNKQFQTRGADLQALIAGHQAELERLTAELATERGPLRALIDQKQGQLDQVTLRIATLAKPLMDQDAKSMKYVGLAGTVMVERTTKMKVDAVHIPVLQKMLAGDFAQYFEIEQKIKPLKRAWELLKVLSGRRLTNFRQIAEIEDSTRARFVP